METPTIVYFEDSETYVIKIGTIKVYLQYGADKTFDWTEEGSNTIHKEGLKIKRDDNDE